MKRHASMNRIYRLVWSQVLGAWVAVAETARGRGKSSARRLIAAALLTLPVVAQAGPVGGQLVAGVGSISQAAATTTVSQISQNAIINWQSFGIAAGESVIFHQPSASSVALNRVIGNSSSQIYGSLAANGQVFLVNPNGVLFGPSARVDVGGLVASTLSIGDTDFLAGKLNFANPGNVGSVINQGRLTAAPGGYIALIAPVVTNSGTITTNNGSAALASGDKLTLDFDGDNLLKIKVDAAAVSAQVINSGAIVADGGRVSLTARAAGNLLGSVINNAGTVQARSMVVRNGEIVLDGGTNGSVGVSGTLDVSGDEARARGGSIGVFGQNIVLQGASLNASGQTGGGSVRVGGDFHGAATQALGNPVANAQSVAVDAASVIKADAGVQGDGGRVVLWSEGSTRFDGSISARGGAQSGSGGNVETSGASLKVGSQARVNTLAANGLTGSWLLDPVDFTIAASGGDITGAALGALLGANNVTLHTAAGVNTATDRYGTTGTAGNINVNDAVTWDTHTLTLTASNDVNINAVMTANNAALVLTPATTKVNVGFNSDGSFKGRVDFFLADGTTPRSGAGFLTMNGVGYTVITALGAQGSVTALDLQGMSGGLAGKYALGANIDATATSGWNAPSGFLPVSTFTGKFDGLGHTITNLFINRPATDLVGLFGLINAATVRNVGMVGGTITGRDGTGALAGNDFESPTYNNYATGAVTGRYSVGGLLGETNYNCCDPIHPSVSNSHATGAVTGSYYGGGLIGFANSPTISNSYATGNVTSTAALHSYFGGLLGYSNSATVSNSYATGNVSAAGNTKVGGLVGYAAGNGLFTDVYATGSVTGSDYVGGLVGRGAYGNAVNRAYASGAVSGSSYVGGLVGQSATGATVSNSYWDIGASGQAASPGGGTGVGALGVSPTADMKKLATFSGSWGANVSATSGGASTWRIYEGSTAPLLRSYLTPLTVTANDAVKTYDGLAYSGAGGVSYSTAPNGNLLGSVSYSSGVNVGSSAITPSGLYSNQQGYDVSYINGTLTINKANLTLSGARAYDGTTVVAGAVITANGVNGESFTVTGLGNATNLASKDVQMGSTLASITGLSLGPDNGAALSSNYNGLSTVGSSITINKAHLTVTANDANRLYGAANPALTTTVTGFVNGEGTGTAAGYGGAGTATTLADVNTNVGTATITAGAGTLTATNYDFTNLVDGTLTINKAHLTVTANDANRLYGAANPALTTTVTGFVNGQGTGTAAGYGGAGTATTLADVNTNVGTATITAGAGTLTATNYDFTNLVDGTLTINKAHLTVTANDASRSYGAANPALTTTVTGFVNGQGTGTAAGYGGAGTATTLADANTNVGTATITAGAGTLTANNYDFPTVVNGTLTIGKATATLTASKTYDGGVNFTGGQITVSGVNGETLALNGAGPATANSKDVANNATNYLTAMGGMTLADGTGLAANYQLPSLAARSANNQATIVAAGLHLLDYTGSKVYDGSASFAFGQLAIAPSSILGTDDVSLASGAASVASKNAGHYAAFVANTLGLGGVDAGNYSAVGGAVSVDITAKPVTLTAPVVSKTYDGGLAYTATPGNLAALGGALVGGDSVIAATIAYTSKNAGSGNKVVSLNAATISDGNGGANYTVTLAGNATSSIDRAPLTLFAQANSKTYDGSTSATAVPVVAGLQPGDSVTDRAETYDNPNAGTGKTLSVSAYTVNDGNGGANYTVSAVNNLAGIINAAVVIPSITSVSGSFTAANKVYDGTTAATIIARNLAGVIGGDDVHLTGGSASFADKNVGQAKLVTATGLYLTGAAAGNYTANSTATTTADITARPLTVTAIAANKVYDATTTASVALHDNRVAGDALSTSYAAANFNSKDVGTGKTVTVSGIGVTGLDAINYRLLSNSAATTADITAASLAASLGVGISAANKVYDGTTAATITNRTLTGVLGADDVHLAGGTANFADKNVGQAKLVTATGLYLIGSAAANYTAASTATTTASISAKPLTPSASTASKVYDATTAATITNRTLVGVIGADDVTLAGGTASFADKNVGVGKLVTATGLYLTGSSAGNYTAASTATTTATISAKPLTLTASAANKVYDATTAATLTARTLTGVIGADDVSLAGGTASFADKNVGTAKLVTATGLYLTGTAAGNYTAASTTTTSADVSAKPLTLTTSVASKVYDGSTAANLTDRSLAGVIGNDDVTLAGGTASFADKNVGQAKLVTATGLYLTGSAAGNYTAASTATTSADITARALTVVATGVNKTYDRTTAATVSLADDRIYGDALATNYGAATFDNKNVGQAKTVTVSGIGISGLDAINYRLVSSTATTTADISAAAVLASLSAGVAADSKVYDGTTAATITARTLAGVIADDEVQLVGGTAAFADKNVGTAKLVTATGLYLTGAAAMNYTANSTATTTADITARPLTVAATASSKVYDGTTAASVSLADNRLSGDLVNTSYAAASFDNPNVGTAKPVTASGIVLSGPDARNYQLQASAASSAADVTARPLTITAQDQTKVYGDADPTLTYLTGGMGLIATDHLTGALSSAPGESVAAYAIDQGSLSAGPNYAIAFRGATLAITPAQLLYLADPATRSAGQANPLFSGAVTGFKFNDSLANATSGALLFTSPATAASPVGSYPIEGHGLTARNYLFAQASTNATALTVAAAPAATVLPPPSDPPAAPLLAATATDPSLLERLLDPLVPCKSTMVANADGGFSIVAVCSD